MKPLCVVLGIALSFSAMSQSANQVLYGTGTGTTSDPLFVRNPAAQTKIAQLLKGGMNAYFLISNDTASNNASIGYGIDVSRGYRISQAIVLSNTKGGMGALYSGISDSINNSYSSQMIGLNFQKWAIHSAGSPDESMLSHNFGSLDFGEHHSANVCFSVSYKDKQYFIGDHQHNLGNGANLFIDDNKGIGIATLSNTANNLLVGINNAAPKVALDVVGSFNTIGAKGTGIKVDDGAGTIQFSFPGHVYKFPAAQGENHQILTTDGVNQLSWETVTPAKVGALTPHIYTVSGAAATTKVTIPHNLSYTPTHFAVTAASHDAGGFNDVSSDATNFYINYTSNVKAGNNNLVYQIQEAP